MPYSTKLRPLLPIVFLFLSAFFGLPSLVPQARATTDLVCIADPVTNPTTCPSSPPDLAGPVGSNVTVAVNIQGSDSLNAFDISVQVDPTVLQPVSISLADSLIRDPRFIVRQSVNSTTGVAQVAVGALGYFVPGPVLGNLFEIAYKVLSSSIGTVIIFKLGCTHQGLNSLQGLCVTVARPNLVPVTVQSATFGGPLDPNFSMAVAPPLRTLLGSSQTVIGSSADSTVVLFGTSGFTGSVNLSTTPPPFCPASTCPSWSLNSTTVALSSEGTAVAALNFSIPPSTPANTWTINVTAASGRIAHTVPATFKIVPPPAFSISADQTTLTITRGQSGTFTIHLREDGCGNISQPEIGCAGLSGSTAISPNVKKAPRLMDRGCTELGLPTFTLLCTGLVTTNSTTHPGTYTVVVTVDSGWVISTLTLTVTIVPNGRASISTFFQS